MTLHNHGYVFTEKKVFLMISYFVIIFLFANIAVFGLKCEYNCENLENICYCHTSRDKVPQSEILLQNANSIGDIKATSDKYVYIKGTLPEVRNCKMFVHSLNGTAKISISGQEIFNNISEKTLSGSSYITVPLKKNMSGSTVEVLLYSPLSDNFEIGIIPADKTFFSLSDIPYTFVYMLLGLLVIFVLSLIFFLISKNKKPCTANVLMFVCSPLAFAIFIFEYWPFRNVTHFLFNAKLFLWLLIPILIIFEISVRFGEKSTKLETVTTINILYAVCIVLLWENVFFYALLYFGVLLQTVNLLFAISVILKQPKPVPNYYCTVAILFWVTDLLLWIAVTVKKITWQPITFVVTVFLYCFCNALNIFLKNRKEKSESEQSFDVIADDARFNTEVSVCREMKKELLYTPTDKSVELNNIVLKTVSDIKISNDCFSAINAFNNKVINRMYLRENHSLNVAEYSRIIASYMGMSRQSADEISRAAALHDIGKICIPETVLFKSGRLSEDEFEEIKKHIIYGYKLLDSDDAFLKMAALVAKEHHEHIDGSGYMGLKGEEISLPAKIVAVADVFDALVSKRSYKESWSFEDTFDYISEHSVDYFDKDVVEAVVSAKDKIYELYSAGILLETNNIGEERN